MGTPLFAASVLFAPLQQLVRRLACPATRGERRSHAVPPAVRVPDARPALHGGAPARPARTSRLRVVRVFDGPQAPAVAGRMVISGRMADVCAELERLEAAAAR